MGAGDEERGYDNSERQSLRGSCTKRQYQSYLKVIICKYMVEKNNLQNSVPTADVTFGILNKARKVNKERIICIALSKYLSKYRLVCLLHKYRVYYFNRNFHCFGRKWKCDRAKRRPLLACR